MCRKIIRCTQLYPFMYAFLFSYYPKRTICEDSSKHKVRLNRWKKKKKKYFVVKMNFPVSYLFERQVWTYEQCVKSFYLFHSVDEVPFIINEGSYFKFKNSIFKRFVHRRWPSNCRRVVSSWKDYPNHHSHRLLWKTIRYLQSCKPSTQIMLHG